MILDWLVIGGGVHGVHIAASLLGQGKVDSKSIRIVDPGERLLEREAPPRVPDFCGFVARRRDQ